jgi:Tfp pilus assembly protein PilO
VNISDRDRRILLILLPIVVLLAYWFLLLSPKRADLTTARDAQTAAESARDQAVAQAAQLQNARQSFAADYAAVVRLGKAIPETVDAPSLLVQLDRASNGTHIDFDKVTFGTRSAATVPTVPVGPAQPGGNAAAGGAPASTGLGAATESAGNTVTQANQASTAAGGTTATTSTTTTTTTPGTAPSTTAPALDGVPLTFNFTGTYFDLADFFHRLKRFVYVANNQIFVRGRLLTIDSLSFAPGATSGGSTALVATVGATVYLSPKSQGGATAGATASGPTGTTTTTTTTPAGSQTSRAPLATTGVR